MLFRFLKPYRLRMILALLLILTELAVELVHPMIMAKIINEGIMQTNLPLIYWWGAVMIGMSLIGFVGGIINSYVASYVSQHVGFDIRERLMEKIQRFSFANFNRFQSASLITRVTSDVSIIQNLVFMGLRIMMRAPLLIIGSIVMALVVDYKLALILVIVMPIVFAFLVWSMKRGFKLFRAVQQRLDRANGVLRENLLGMRLIRAFVRQDHENKRFADANEELRETTKSALRLMELTFPIVLLILNLSILTILWLGNREVLIGGANTGEVVAVINYSMRITGAFSVLSFILMNLSRSKASLQRISEVMETEVDLTDSNKAKDEDQIRNGSITFDGVSFQYPGYESSVLKSISFTISSGQTVAILGATGSGKSSLFQLIPRLYDVNEGTVRIDGYDIREMKMEQLRNQIGYVPQEALLFTGTVMENIVWGKESATVEEVIEASKHAQIHETIMKLPNQYETILGQKGVNLSGGQKQRLSIARALIRNPKILLLDDSTSALDANTEAKLMDALQSYPCTTLIITQKVSTAQQADHVIVLEDGILLAQGTHDELLVECELYQRIVESQYGKEAVAHG
ncbi:ABC transporter ATP-binding protein/permease [Paenibacillus sp. N1-5-1-14]|nr:ABC transporter ATP-binding protein [Paenibacillus radicibacter]MCR8642784.1 ABC transporter ATP-binding protein/permease [Paenibacillus radicibacter]